MPNYLCSAEFLRDAEVEVLTDHYNQGPLLLFIGDHLQHDDVPGAVARDREGHETTRFVQYPHFDVLLFLIARDVQSARLSRVGVK